MTGPETEGLAVTLARVEGKLDAYAARTSAVEQRVDDLDVRVRASASAEDLQTLEGRVRTQETRSVVTPAGLLAAISGTVTALGGLAAFIRYVA